jgi:mono/diheme cytochrome c family protein
MMILKRMGLGIAAASALGLLVLAPISTPTATATQEVTAAKPAEFYNAKCKMCHGPKAEKKFNAEAPEAEMIDAILKGKKAEKPPNMPEYGSKGVTAEQAKAMLDYMKSLKGS